MNERMNVGADLMKLWRVPISIK